MHDKETTVQTNFLVEILSAIVSGLWLIVQEAVRWFAFPQKKSIEREIVLITGAGDGIGKSLAFKYAAAGATVVAVDINKKNVEQLIKELAAKKYTKAFAYVCDVGNRDQVLAMAKQVEVDVGGVTILINNAGVLYANRIWDVAPEHVRKTFDVNVFSNFWTIEAFLPAMRKHNKGHIVSICSTAGLTGVKNLALYCSTKYAVRGLMESLRTDIRSDKNSKIKTTCVYPFMVKTDLCSRPSIRFERLMPLLDKEYVAKCVMNAQRREISDVSVPFHLFFAEKIFRLLPLRLQDRIIDFLDMTILPEEKSTGH